MRQRTRPGRPLDEALKRTGNPYAVLQTGPVPGDVHEWSDAARDPVAQRVRLLENPYAPLAFADAEPSANTTTRLPAARPEPKGLTKAAYRSEVSRILLGYLPRGTAKRLLAHHREFIARTEVRSATARGSLLAALKRYDLGEIPGLQPQFNRERDIFTREKLAAIERSVSDQ